MLCWLSFIDDTETPSRHLGCCIVDVEPSHDADAVILATIKAHTLNINPGGQVAVWELPPELDATYRPYLDRLMTADELRAAGLAE